MADLEPPLTRLQRYVESLPKGLDAHPEYQHKGEVIRQFLADRPMAKEAHRLPEPLAQMITNPPLSTAWVPEVHAHALYVAACDLYFPDDAAFIDHVRTTNRRLVGGPIFRALFQLVPVAQMLRGATWRWDQFHRGTKLQLLSHAPGRAELRLNFPAGLVPVPMPGCYATALEVAVEASGGKNVRFPVADQTETSVLYQGTWS